MVADIFVCLCLFQDLQPLIPVDPYDNLRRCACLLDEFDEFYHAAPVDRFSEREQKKNAKIGNITSVHKTTL